ncbi:DNA-binding protein [Mixta intestinalis]|uniref:Uncharacterized protein n=1 Tax=Mixta intestinalis TaxID=1615494 RepID=A0A6P1Q7N8_9GAMM|nr:DNA-binding protein [Mixta intestinalis]QHM73988.1 hypothetical protein C7M51_04349 [Mixta intestinalis]
MSKKVLNSKQFDEILNTLNSLICNDNKLKRTERSILVKSVAIIGMLKERETKTENKIDPLYPNAGKRWSEEDESFLFDLTESIPNDEITHQIEWLAGKLGRTPYAIATKIVSSGRLDMKWAENFKVSNDIHS